MSRYEFTSIHTSSSYVIDVRSWMYLRCHDGWRLRLPWAGTYKHRDVHFQQRNEVPLCPPFDTFVCEISIVSVFFHWWYVSIKIICMISFKKKTSNSTRRWCVRTHTVRYVPGLIPWWSLFSHATWIYRLERIRTVPIHKNV